VTAPDLPTTISAFFQLQRRIYAALLTIFPNYSQPTTDLLSSIPDLLTTFPDYFRLAIDLVTTIPSISFTMTFNTTSA